MKAPAARHREGPMVEGSPRLAVADEERGQIEDLVAELICAALERDEEPAK